MEEEKVIEEDKGTRRILHCGPIIPMQATTKIFNALF